MKRIMTTQVGADGILTLTVPLARADANKVIRVTLETLDEAAGTPVISDHCDWLEFIERTAGSITDPTFVRPAQGGCEESPA